MTCETCSNNKQNKLTVPFAVYEMEQARHERYVKRITIALVFALFVFLISNLMWFRYSTRVIRNINTPHTDTEMMIVDK